MPEPTNTRRLTYSLAKTEEGHCITTMYCTRECNDQGEGQPGRKSEQESLREARQPEPLGGSGSPWHAALWNPPLFLGALDCHLFCNHSQEHAPVSATCH